MQIGASLFQPRFRPAVHSHPEGGLHLDAFAVDPGLSVLVSDADTAQYDGGAGVSSALEERDVAPEPTERLPADHMAFWLDDRLAAAEQWAAYRHLAHSGRPDMPLLQIGGRGSALVRWMRATGREGVLLAPFGAELDHCRRLAASAGVVAQLVTVRGPAEEVPLSAGVIGAAILPGVLHHTDVRATLAELTRVLAPGGAFASWDVWSSPAYRLGIRLFGKQEAIACRPLTHERLASADLSGVTVSWGGCLTRYPIALLSRLGLPLSAFHTVRWGLVDRALCRRLPWLTAATASLVSLHGSVGWAVVLPDTGAAASRVPSAQGTSSPWSSFRPRDAPARGR